MNSIYDLNHRSRIVEYSDDRATGVFFDRASAQNKVVNVLEGQSFSVPEGIRITSIVNYASAGVSVTFDFTNIDNLGDEEFSVTWGSTPVHLTLDDSTPGIYIWSGLRDAYDWTQLVNATVQLPNDYNGSTTFTVRIDYLSTYFKEYTVTVNVTNVAEWSSYNNPDFWFDTGVNSILTAPYLGDVGNPIANWRVIIYPNNYSYITLLATSGTGGTSIWDPVVKNLTITGTNTQINSHLASLQLTTNGDVNTDFTLNYLAQGVVNGETDLTTQKIRCTLTRYLGVVRGTVDYTEEATKSISNGPLITDVDYDGSGNYTLLITPSTPAYVKTLSSAGTGGTTNFNATTKILTITGTRTQVNSHINAISMLTASDVNSNFTLNYYVNTAQSGNLVGGKNQTVLGTNTPEVSNISDIRTYINGTTNTLFPTNIPQITDTDTATGITYTVTFVSTLGILGGGAGGDGTGTWTYTGTKTQVNSQFSQITLIADINTWQDTTISYTQAKYIDSTFFSTQVSTTITLQGPRVAFSPLSATNQTINTTEGGIHSVPVGANIVGVNDYAVTAPTYTINLTNCTGATVVWPSVGGTTTSTPSAGVFRISGIPTDTVWNQIKSPSIALPNDYYGTFTYSATVNWTGGGSQSWTVTTIVTDQYPLTTVSNFSYYSGGAIQTITGVPQLQDSGYQTPTWTVTVTPSRIISGMTMSATGASFNATTKVLTITGTISQINARLTVIRLTSPYGYDLDYTLTYYATNNLNAETGTRVQTLTSNNYTFLAATRGTPTYQTNTPVNIASGPLITEVAYSGAGLYALTIAPNPGASTASISSSVTSSWVTDTFNAYALANSTGIWGSNAGYYQNYFISDIDNANMVIAVIDTGASKIYTYERQYSGSPSVPYNWFVYQEIPAISGTLSVSSGLYNFGMSGGGNVIVKHLTNNTYQFMSNTLSNSHRFYSKVTFYDNASYQYDLAPANPTGYDGGTTRCILVDYYGYSIVIISGTQIQFYRRTPQVYVSNPTSSDGGSIVEYQNCFTTTLTNVSGMLSGDGNTLVLRGNDPAAGGALTCQVYYLTLRNNSIPAGVNAVYWQLVTSNSLAGSNPNSLNPQSNIAVSYDGNYIAYRSGTSLMIISSPNSSPQTQILTNVFTNTYAKFRFDTNAEKLIVTDSTSKLYIRGGTQFVAYSATNNSSFTFASSQIYLNSIFWFINLGNLTGAARNSIYSNRFLFTATVSWDNTSKVFTVTGIKSDVNNVINSLTLTPATGYAASFELIYSVDSPAGSIPPPNSQRNQNIIHP
jgi:hypothetical protein